MFYPIICVLQSFSNSDGWKQRKKSSETEISSSTSTSNVTDSQHANVGKNYTKLQYCFTKLRISSPTSDIFHQTFEVFRQASTFFLPKFIEHFFALLNAW
jgi:hypothetical protein